MRKKFIETLDNNLSKAVTYAEAVMGGVTVGEVLAVLFKPSILELFHQYPALVVAGLIGALSIVSAIDSISETNQIQHHTPGV